MEHIFFGIITLFLAVFFGLVLGGYAKFVLRDRRKTETFILIAIISTIAFMIWAFLYGPE